MPVPPSLSPFPRDQELFKYSLSKVKLKRMKREKKEETKYKPDNFITNIESANYRALEEDDFYRLISEGREAVVNFSEGDGYKTSAFHAFLKILSIEHEEDEFYHVDTGKNRELKKMLGIRTNPTLVVISENDVRDVVSDKEDFKSKFMVTLSALKARLASSGVTQSGGIIPDNPQEIDEEFVRDNVETKLRTMRKQLGILH